MPALSGLCLKAEGCVLNRVLPSHGIYGFLLALTPILNEYDFAGLPIRFGMFILLIEGVYFLPNSKFSNRMLIVMTTVMTVVFIENLSLSGASIDFLYRFINILASFFIIAVLPQTVTYDNLRSPLSTVLSIVSAGLIAQILMWQYFGGFLSLEFDNVLFSQHQTESFNITSSRSGADVYRPSSFFSESSRFGLFLGFVLHFLTLKMSSPAQLTKVYILGFILAALSTSGTAMLLVTFSLVLKITTLGSKAVKVNLVFIFFVVLLGLYFASNGYVFERFLVSGGRLFNGVNAFNSLGDFEYFFGVGLGKGKELMSHYEFPFISGLPLALVELGVVGASLLGIAILAFVYNLKSNLARQFVYIWVLCLVFEQVLFGYCMVLPIVFAIIVERRGSDVNYAVNCNTNKG